MSGTETPFAKVPQFLIQKLAQGPASAILVYLGLASHRNKNGLAWPSVETLTGYANRDRSTVFDAIKWLKLEGLIVKRGYEKHGTARYYLPQLARELPLIAAAAGIELGVGDSGPSGAGESGQGSGSSDWEGRAGGTQTDQRTEEHEPQLGGIEKQILDEPAFFGGLPKQQRVEKAIEVGSIAQAAGIPASRVSELVTEAWSIDKDRIGETLIALLSEAGK